MAPDQGFPKQPTPCTLAGHGVRLEPLSMEHAFDSIAGEWPEVHAHLTYQLKRHAC